MSDTNTRDFNLAAQTWDDNPMRVELACAISNAILSRIPVSGDMDVLDYGAGTGLVTLGLQAHVRSILAADSSRGMLDRLNEKVAASGLVNVKTRLLDLECDSAPEQHFDLIVSTMTFHHIEDISTLIRCLCGMLRSGGLLAVADLDLDNGEFHQDSTGVRHNGLDRNEMVLTFADSGLSRIEVETAHTLVRDVQEKGPREFSVFLITGRKA
ncbi:MAG: class I SAM-dependent methyltransferase [Armatimonadota bacterium]